MDMCDRAFLQRGYTPSTSISVPCSPWLTWAPATRYTELSSNNAAYRRDHGPHGLAASKGTVAGGSDHRAEDSRTHLRTGPGGAGRDRLGEGRSGPDERYQRTAPHRPGLERLGGKVWDPDKVTVISDHFVPASDDTEAAIQRVTREWVQAKGIKKFHFFEGIMHIVSVERGYIWPGMLMVGADSHSVTGGALGCLSIPVGSTEILGVVATGEIWLRVPETIDVRWTGRLRRA